jgi:predicted aldo/keto reductase-like oxidoreductase
VIYRDFGKTGMRVSAIGMGCEYVWTADEKQIFDLVRAAVDAGINYFDLFAAGNILKNHEEGRLKGLLSLTPVQCISYVLSFPQVACPVPGFANVDELNQSLAYLTASEEERDFSEIQDSLVGQFANRCMYCNHCQPCPKKIDIAEVTKLADMAEQEMTDELRERYAALLVTGEDCIHCGSCTKRCPFGIDASENMRRAQMIFGC